MTRTEEVLPPCFIFIDKEGNWYHRGVEMIRRDFIRMFYDNLRLDEHGRYVIHWEGERCYVDVEDTAFVVRSVHHEQEPGGQNARILLELSDDTREELMPGTLSVGQQNVLYCKVKNLAFPARFSRAAYYQLAESIVEENGHYYLPVRGKKFRIL